MPAIDILDHPPFALDAEQKRALLTDGLSSLGAFHADRCPPYKRIVQTIFGGRTGAEKLDGSYPGHGAQVEQRPTGAKYPPDLPQGMDHALVGDSSQRPAEDRQVEAVLAEREDLGPGAHALQYAPIRRPAGSLRVDAHGERGSPE